MMVRQGDLLIVKIDAVPQEAVKLNHRILAEGEATGHMHELDSGVLYESNGTLYFSISDKNSILKHPEHNAVTFTPGTYKVIRQREYEPSGWKQVGD